MHTVFLPVGYVIHMYICMVLTVLNNLNAKLFESPFMCFNIYLDFEFYLSCWVKNKRTGFHYGLTWLK